MPALFPVAGGGIEVAVSMFGLKRCHFVAADGSERQLEPDPRSGEGRRAQLERSNPGLSRLIGGAAMLVLLVSLGLLLLQLAEHGVLCSSGSACAAGSDEPSHVLTALGFDGPTAQTAVRFTLASSTTGAELDAVVIALRASLDALGALSTRR